MQTLAQKMQPLKESRAARPRCKEAIMTTEAKQEAQQAGPAAGVGQVFGGALQQQIAQALQPALKDLQQQMAQSVQQQMEQELEPVRQELHKQVDTALEPVQEELHKQIEQALEPMRQELQKQVDQVLQQEVEAAVSSLFG